MTVVTIAIVGITAVMLAVQMKSINGEYGTYLVMAAGCFGSVFITVNKTRVTENFLL